MNGSSCGLFNIQTARAAGKFKGSQWSVVSCQLTTNNQQPTTDNGLILRLLLLRIDLRHTESLKNIGREQRVIDVVEPCLQQVQIVMQPMRKNIVDAAELDFRQQPPGKLFCLVGKAVFGHARDTPQRRVKRRQAEAHGARKI